MRTLPARHSAAGASVLVLSAGVFAVSASAAGVAGARSRGFLTCSLSGAGGDYPGPIMPELSDHSSAFRPEPTSASGIPEQGSSSVRVRFCPSPTGTPHVGMVRTCLFNWAYARHTGGTFVFRIEDTDAARDSEESFDAILDSLTWLGLDWDEGVGKGGPHEPYRQSQRMDLYKEVAAELLEAGYLYESFSTPEEIEARHRERGEDPKLGYDGFDRDLTQEQKDAFRAEGRLPVLRMRMPEEDWSAARSPSRPVACRTTSSCAQAVSPSTPWSTPLTTPRWASPTFCAVRTCCPPPRGRWSSTGPSWTSVGLRSFPSSGTCLTSWGRATGSCPSGTPSPTSSSTATAA